MTQIINLELVPAASIRENFFKFSHCENGCVFVICFELFQYPSQVLSMTITVNQLGACIEVDRALIDFVEKPKLKSVPVVFDVSGSTIHDAAVFAKLDMTEVFAKSGFILSNQFQGQRFEIRLAELAFGLKITVNQCLKIICSILPWCSRIILTGFECLIVIFNAASTSLMKSVQPDILSNFFSCYSRIEDCDQIMKFLSRNPCCLLAIICCRSDELGFVTQPFTTKSMNIRSMTTEARASKLFCILCQFVVIDACDGYMRSKQDLLIPTLVPLEQLYVPEHLNGSAGAFRGNLTNTLGANTDLQAIEAWFKLLASTSNQTQIAYKREIERFYLWALLECRKPLSSLDAVDCASYKAFLQQPPAHWVCALPYPRSHARWKPFRGELSAASAQRSLAAVSRLFDDLVSAQYLRANSMPRMGGSRSETVRLDVMRSFAIEDQVHIANTLKTLPDTASGRRTRALVMLLMSAGLRASETQTSHASIIRLREREHVTDNMGLTVIGKGNKERIVPLRVELLESLNQHKADLTKVCTTPENQLPLIGTLVKAPCKYANQVTMPGSTLSTAGMYSVLKAFFANVAKQHSVHADFEKASAHWMRHTFAHQVLAATDNDLSIVQQLLGHSSIQTTAIYVKANVESRTKAINAMLSPIYN